MDVSTRALPVGARRRAAVLFARAPNVLRAALADAVGARTGTTLRLPGARATRLTARRGFRQCGLRGSARRVLVAGVPRIRGARAGAVGRALARVHLRATRDPLEIERGETARKREPNGEERDRGDGAAHGSSSDVMGQWIVVEHEMRRQGIFFRGGDAAWGATAAECRRAPRARDQTDRMQARPPRYLRDPRDRGRRPSPQRHLRAVSPRPVAPRVTRLRSPPPSARAARGTTPPPPPRAPRARWSPTLP